MKKILNLSVLLLAAALILGLAGCEKFFGGDSGGGVDDPPDESSVSFENFSSPSIYVDNQSGERLVAYKGSLNPNYLISGIPAYATYHGLKKEGRLFNSTGDFALILITENEYNQKKDNIASAEIFAQIYAFYNHEATNNNSFKISAKSGGSGRITLNNPTGWNIEIRRDGPTGEVLGYVADFMTNTVLRVNAPDDYSLYPVLKKFIASDKEIYEVVPKYTSGALEGKPYAKDFALTSANGTATWNLAEAVEKVSFTLSSGSFYLRIINNSSTAIRFTRGDTPILTSMGINGIPSANANLYSIKLQRNPDGTYPETETVSYLRVGTPQYSIPIPANEYKLDYLYTIEVTGSDASNLALGEIVEGSRLNLEAMFGF